MSDRYIKYESSLEEQKSEDVAVYQQEDVSKALKLDPKGLPLIPQPTDSTSDPLNWSPRWRWFIVAQCCIICFFAQFAFAVMNPAYAQVAKALHLKGVPQAAYIGAISIATAGVGTLLWAPLSSVYGRRPVLLFALLVAVAAGFGSAASPSYGGIIAARAVVGFFSCAANVICFSIVSDLFCLHERGRALGLVTVALINGPHVASLPGGFIAQYVNWRWTLWLPSICSAAACLMALCFLPETLFVRGVEHPHVENPIRARLALWQKPRTTLKLSAFARPFQMAAYPTVTFVAFYAGVAFLFGSVLPAQTCSGLFAKVYHWKSARTGLTLSLSTTAGGLLGEFLGGPVVDYLMNRSRQKTGHMRPEVRLLAMIPAVLILPAGLISFGYTLEESPVGPAVSMAFTCLAVQIIATSSITYVVDCYKPQAAEVVLLLNFFRQEIAFSVGFWSLPFGEKIGFDHTALVYAGISLFFALPVAYVYFYGEQIRARMGTPQFNKGL